ncbi:hypothetical protein F383_39393 [Gossypium arboreum]|nr:hypothetical protein F383_39393 [Gossypium arboreum]
MLMRLRV